MKHTIALVDDDRNILTSVQMTLEQEGFLVRTYTDGESALQALLAKPVDLAVLDIKMPRMDGMELLQKLRANPAGALLVTGSARDENPQTAARILLTGEAVQCDAPQARAAFLQKHPYAKLYCDFGDFHFWRLVVKDAHYVGGFAAAARLDIAALQHEINLLLAKSSG